MKAVNCNLGVLEQGTEDKELEMVMRLSEHLKNKYNCSEKDLIGMFYNVDVEKFIISDIHSWTPVKYFRNVRKIQLYSITTEVCSIVNVVNEIALGKEVELSCCILKDTCDDVCTGTYKLASVEINGCTLNEKSFTNLYKWIIDSVEKLHLGCLYNIGSSWWGEMASYILGAEKEKRLTLKTLSIYKCNARMNEEVRLKVRKL